MTRAHLKTLILNWIDKCPVREEVFGCPKSVETHTTQMSAWTEGNIVSSESSCREGEGDLNLHRHPTPGSTPPLWDFLEDCEVEHLVHDPRIWVALWFQRARVDSHPKRCSCPKSFYSSTTDRGILQHPWCFLVLICQSYLQTVFCKFHFLEDLQSVSEQCLTHLSKFRTTEARQLAKDSLGFFLLQLEIL